jgi:antitoxin PrlF
MDTDIIEMGSISSRGQIAIPSEIRRELGLEEGSKVVFTVKNNAVIMKKVTAASFDELAIPFTDAKKKIREDEVTDLIHKLRREKKI